MNRKTGVLLSYILMAVEIFSTLLFTPFLIRSLGRAEYGIYQLIMSVTAYLALLDLGVGNSVIRYMSKYRAEKDKLSQKQFLGVTTIYYFAIAIIVLIIGTILRYFLPSFFKVGLTAEEISLARKLFSVTMCTTAVSLATSGFANAVIAYERFDISKGTAIVMNIIKVLASIVALKLGFSSCGIVFIHLLVTIVTRAVYVLFIIVKEKVVPVFTGVKFSFVKEIISYSLFILLQLIATNINALSDQVLLGIFAKGASVIIAVYGVGAQVLQYFKTIGSHFTSVLMPGLVRLVHSGADSKVYEKEMIRISRIVFIALGMIFTVFAFNGMDFVVLWAGEEYREAFYVAIILMFPTMLSYTEGVGYQLLQAMKKHKTPAIIQVVSALLNIVLTILLIKWKPLEGAVIGSFIALFVCELIVMNIMYKREIGISLISYFKGLLKGTLPCLLISAALGFAFNRLGLIKYGWLGFAVNCAVMVAVYAVTMLLFGMNSYEKELVFKPVKKIKNRFHRKGDINVYR